MRRGIWMGSMVSGLAAMVMSAGMVTGLRPISPLELAAEERETKRRRKAVAAGALQKFRRGRRVQAKPRCHANRLHISRRARRRHRRAA